MCIIQPGVWSIECGQAAVSAAWSPRILATYPVGDDPSRWLHVEAVLCPLPIEF